MNRVPTPHHKIASEKPTQKSALPKLPAVPEYKEHCVPIVLRPTDGFTLRSDMSPDRKKAVGEERSSLFGFTPRPTRETPLKYSNQKISQGGRTPVAERTCGYTGVKHWAGSTAVKTKLENQELRKRAQQTKMRGYLSEESGKTHIGSSKKALENMYFMDNFAREIVASKPIFVDGKWIDGLNLYGINPGLDSSFSGKFADRGDHESAWIGSQKIIDKHRFLDKASDHESEDDEGNYLLVGDDSDENEKVENLSYAIKTTLTFESDDEQMGTIKDDPFTPSPQHNYNSQLRSSNRNPTGSRTARSKEKSSRYDTEEAPTAEIK